MHRRQAALKALRRREKNKSQHSQLTNNSIPCPTNDHPSATPLLDSVLVAESPKVKFILSPLADDFVPIFSRGSKTVSPTDASFPSPTSIAICSFSPSPPVVVNSAVDCHKSNFILSPLAVAFVPSYSRPRRRQRPRYIRTSRATQEHILTLQMT